jgi:hypothetical protein
MGVSQLVVSGARLDKSVNGKEYPTRPKNSVMVMRQKQKKKKGPRCRCIW